MSTLLTTVLNQPGAIGNGTQKYVVKDDLGGSFSFELTSTGQPGNGGKADNGACQINGGAVPLFTGCTLAEDTSPNQSTIKGGPQLTGVTFPVTITFTGSAAAGQTFDLGFVSMQGTSNVTTVPEPSSLALFGTSLLLAGWFVHKKIGIRH